MKWRAVFYSILSCIQTVDRELLSNQKDNYFCRHAFLGPCEPHNQKTKNNPLKAVCGFGFE